MDDPTDPFHSDSQRSSAGVVAVFHSSNMVFRDDKGVEVGEGMDVEECQAEFVLVHLVGRRVPRNDLAEDAARLRHAVW